MTININRFLENIINICTIFLFSSFFIFESYAWGRYILVGISALIFLLYVIYKGPEAKIYIGQWHLFVFMFGIVCLLTALVSIRYSDSIGKFKFIIQILLCFTPLYTYYGDGDKIGDLLNVIKWAGYIVAIYSMSFYGIDFVLNMLKSSIRLENSYANVNVIGQISAIAIIIQVYQLLNLKKKSIVSCLFMIPTLLMILATQSRKAFILLIMGLFLVYIMSNDSHKKAIKIVLKIILATIILIIIIKSISKFSIFAGIDERMRYLLDSLNGKDGGNSANLRKQLVAVGWNTFLQYPFLGIGIGCPHVIALQKLSFDAYLHNNYIELLCGGGVIGFLTFYSIYLYLIKKFWDFREINHYGKNICVILLASFLVLEWGKVSCYSKETYFYFMLFFLEIKQLKCRWYNDKKVY